MAKPCYTSDFCAIVAMIELHQVQKSFVIHKNGTKSHFDAIKPLSLVINAGEIFGLMGYSGAGKSTLLRLINLLERPDSGRVYVDGKDLTQMNAHALRHARHGIGMIFQQFNLLANKTVYDNIAFNLQIAGYTGDMRTRILQCLEIVNLSERAHHYPAELSGGQKQRVGIARAIATSPKVLLADEPTSALDPDTTRALLTCLADINKNLGTTIVIVTHEMSVIRRICHRSALLDRGELIEIAPIVDGAICPISDIGKRLVLED